MNAETAVPLAWMIGSGSIIVALLIYVWRDFGRRVERGFEKNDADHDEIRGVVTGLKEDHVALHSKMSHMADKLDS